MDMSKRLITLNWKFSKGGHSSKELAFMLQMDYPFQQMTDKMYRFLIFPGKEVLTFHANCFLNPEETCEFA